MRESIHGKVRIPENAKAIEYGRRAGYNTGGAVDEGDKEAVHKHEKHLHKGEPETPLKVGKRVKRKAGGSVPGVESAPRLDKRARGGKTGKTNIIINTSPPGGAPGGADPAALQQAKQEGAKMGAMAVITKLKGAGGPPGMGAPPPGGAPPMGAPPMGGPPPGMPPMHAKGGKVGSEPETVKVKGHVRRKAGGKVGC